MARIDARAVLRALGPPPSALRVGDRAFPVVTTAGDFGGRAPGRVRPWIVCGCGRRVGVLYSPDGGRWACRRCWTARYPSDGWHRGRRRRVRAWKIRRRLGDSVSLEDYLAVGFRPVPPRPPGMWRRAYRALVEELHLLEGTEPGAPRSGQPSGMTTATYERTLARMARSQDGGAAEAGAVALRAQGRALRRRPHTGNGP